MNRNNILLLTILLLPGFMQARSRLLLRDSTPLPVNARAWDLIGLSKTAHFAVFRHPIKVAIIDDGFDLDNPLWAASIAHNAGEIPGNNVDDDHDGKIDNYEGWDFGDNDEDVRPAKSVVDKESHGTRVLGIFWQVLEQISAGAPSGITILPVKAVSDGRMNNYIKEGYKGIEYAIRQKADIIICSWSGSSVAPEEKALLALARERGIIIIASAGNFYALDPQYPGAFPSVIDVAATDDTGHKLHVSNYGTFVDICAPGDSLLTYNPYSRVPKAWLSGTSASTPVVAAIITAVRAAWPGLSPAAIERLLKNTAIPLDSANALYAGNLGAGLINVPAIRAALDGKLSPSYPAISPTNTGCQPQGYIDLRGLQPATPVRITPAGRYPGIKFILQSPETSITGLPAVRMTLFRDGHTTDTFIRGRQLKYPFIAIADSIYLYTAMPNKTTGPGRGPASWWYYSVMTIDSSNLYCGSFVNVTTDPEGILEDGSGDATYTGRNDCKWQFIAPAGKRIKFNFEQFDTEPKIDQVYIFNGNSTKDPILAIFSGHKLPPPITSWGNSVLVWFVTSEQNNYQGWRLHYKVVD